MADIRERGLTENFSTADKPFLTADGRGDTVFSRLKKLGMKTINFIGQKGDWLFRRHLENDLIYTEPEKLGNSLITGLENAYEALDLVLQNSDPKEYFTNGADHVIRLMNSGHKLLRKKYPFENNIDFSVRLNSLLIASALHDLQMLAGREASRLPSQDMVARVYGDNRRRVHDFERIAHAINGHRQDVASKNPNLLAEDETTLLLLLANESDWHREGIIWTTSDLPDLIRDKEVRMRAFNPRPIEIYFGTEGKEATISIPFSQLDVEQNLPPIFHKDNEPEKIKVPPEWKIGKETEGVPYVNWYMGQIRKYYSRRVALMTAATFGLFGTIQTVAINVFDVDFKDFTGFTVGRDGQDSWQLRFGLWHYMNYKNQIRNTLAKGEIPKFPAFYGPDILARLHKRYKFNLPVADEKVHSS